MQGREILLALLAVAMQPSGTFAGTEGSRELLTPRIVPVPRKAVFELTNRVDVTATPVVLRCDDAGACVWAEGHLREWLRGFSVPPVSFASRDAVLPHGDEAYRLEVSPARVVVTANTLQGVRYALFSYRQTWEARRGTLKTMGYTAPCSRVDDWPALPFRGLHLCWFAPDDGVTLRFMEHQLRMAAYCKLNHVVIESWGVVRSERYPDLGWGGKRSFSLADVRRLAAQARDLGLTVVPQLNVFGHAAMARYATAKHAVLDCRREYEPLFEPYGGWNWCLTNPEVLKVQTALIDELLEAWGRPKFFHIGCDEAEPPSCSACCAGDYRKVVAEHLCAIVAHLEKQGVRTLMWHDMLLRRGDERFKGFYCYGAQDAEQLLDSLPRSVVICDWCYLEPQESYPTMDYFKAKGFDVLTCPWDRREGIRAQVKWARERGLFGALFTTWHHLVSYDYAGIWREGPSSAWGAPDWERLCPEYLHVASMWRLMGWDMGLGPDEYEEFGLANTQTTRKMKAPPER